MGKVWWLVACALSLAGGCSEEVGPPTLDPGSTGGAGTGGGPSTGGSAGKGGNAGSGGLSELCPPRNGIIPTGACAVPSNMSCQIAFVDCCIPITHGYAITYRCVDGMWENNTSGSCRACPSSGGAGGQVGNPGGEGGEGGEGAMSSAGASGEGGAR